jgi:hypothetical protein
MKYVPINIVMWTVIGSFLVSVITAISYAALLFFYSGCYPLVTTPITYPIALAAGVLGLTTWLVLSFSAIPRAVAYLIMLKKKQIEGRVITGVITLCLGFLPVLVLVTSVLADYCWGGGVYYRVWSSTRIISANSNDAATVFYEVNSPSCRSLIARTAGVTALRVRNLRIQFYTNDLTRYTLSRRINDKVANVVSDYISCRAQGHSAAYCHDVLRLLADPSSETNKYLADIRAKEGGIPNKWIRNVAKCKSMDGVNIITFHVIDGEIAWSYEVSYLSDGQLRYCSSERLDPLDFNPTYTNIIIEVKKQVEEKMKEDGSYGKFGSCHHYWELKKQLLKERGIKWMSPSELNPGTCYD